MMDKGFPLYIEHTIVKLNYDPEIKEETMDLFHRLFI